MDAPVSVKQDGFAARRRRLGYDRIAGEFRNDVGGNCGRTLRGRELLHNHRQTSGHGAADHRASTLGRSPLNPPHPAKDITALIQGGREGDHDANESLFRILSEQMHAAASRWLLREADGRDWQASGLVNEACLKLLSSDVVDRSPNRRYLFAAAHRAMRQILIDYGRRRRTEKHGANFHRMIGPEDASSILDQIADNIHRDTGFDGEALAVALEELERSSPRQMEVVQCRFFSGLSVPETATLLQISEATVHRDWRLARATLYARLTDPA